MSVRKNGYTDEQLMQQLIEEIYLPLYPNCAKDTVRDKGGTFIQGLIIIKTNLGQG